MKKISVIVPVYGVEKYLNRCVESIVNQTYKNLEIILVDDGSPDKCPQLCDEWANRDDRIKVIHKLNGGVSSARNEGIRIATGEFLTFIDSDDYVMPEFSDVIKFLKNNDILCVPYYELRNGKISRIERIGLRNKYVENIDKKRRLLINYNMVCNKIYRYNWLKNNCLKFDTKLKIAEDLKFFISNCVNKCKMDYIGIPYYVYNRNNESVMANVSFNKICNTLDVSKYIIDLTREMSDKAKVTFFKKIICENLLSVFIRSNSYEENQNQYLQNELIKLKKYFKYGSNFKKKVVVFLIRICGIKFSVRILKRFL